MLIRLARVSITKDRARKGKKGGKGEGEGERQRRDTENERLEISRDPRVR